MISLSMYHKTSYTCLSVYPLTALTVITLERRIIFFTERVNCTDVNCPLISIVKTNDSGEREMNGYHQSFGRIMTEPGIEQSALCTLPTEL